MELAYTLDTIPVNGQLELTTNVGVVITSFTQDDIDNIRVIYEHDVSQTSSDSFDFTLADGAEDGVSSATGTFNFTVANVNDVPSGVVTIDNASPDEGDILTASNTLFDEDGLGTMTYKWQRGGVDISGATGSTYTAIQADVGSTPQVLASYTDAQGTPESVPSAATSPVLNVIEAALPETPAVPETIEAIDNGNAEEYKLLVAIAALTNSVREVSVSSVTVGLTDPGDAPQPFTTYEPIQIYGEEVPQDFDAGKIEIRRAAYEPPPPIEGLLGLSLVLAPFPGSEQADQYAGLTAGKSS